MERPSASSTEMRRPSLVQSRSPHSEQVWTDSGEPSSTRVMVRTSVDPQMGQCSCRAAMLTSPERGPVVWVPGPRSATLAISTDANVLHVGVIRYAPPALSRMEARCRSDDAVALTDGLVAGRVGAVLARRNLGDAIFGRKSEIATLNVFLRPGEGPRALVLEGEPGIGKTTLWQAAVEDARTRGLQVLASSPVSVERQLSFAALADLLTDRLDAVASRLPLPQRRALEIALLLEDPAGGTAERRTVAAATLSALRELCGADPLLLAVDDVQWLDEPSAAALSFAMRRLGDAPVSVLAARRVEPSSPAPTDLETAIERRHGADLTRVRLGPLSIEALHAAIQDRLGAAFPHWVLEQLHQTSRGNPFYAFELSLALLRRGETLERGHSLPVPETLQGLVRERIDALPPDVRDVLPVVAALSDPTTEVVEASGVGGAIDEAIRAGVLELGRGGRLR